MFWASIIIAVANALKPLVILTEWMKSQKHGRVFVWVHSRSECAVHFVWWSADELRKSTFAAHEK